MTEQELAAKLKAMTADERRAFQTTLLNAGYRIAVDGQYGPQTLAAALEFERAREREEMTRAAREADTATKLAASKAEEAKARAAEAESKRREKKDDAASDPTNRAVKLGVQLGSAGLGLAGGYHYAGNIGRDYVARQSANNAELKNLAGAARSEFKSPSPAHRQKLKSIQGAGRAIGLNRVKGPLGLVPAGVLVAKGLGERGVGAFQDDELAREALNAVGTASTVAGGTVLARRALARGYEGVPPDARDLATLYEVDERLADPVRPQRNAPPAPSPRSQPAMRPPTRGQIRAARAAGVQTPGWYRSADELQRAIDAAQQSAGIGTGGGGPVRRALGALGRASRFLVPAAAAVVGGLDARDAYAEDGSVGDAALAGGATFGDFMLGGAPSAYSEARQAGYGKPASAGIGAGAFGDAVLTGGMARTMLDPSVDPEFKRTATLNMALPTGSALNVMGGVENPGSAFAAALLELKQLLLGESQPRASGPAAQGAHALPPVTQQRF